MGLAQLSKTLIKVRGPDATKFLNGLITSRLLPNIVKKKQHTISESEENRNTNLAEVIDVSKNYGLIHEDIYDPNGTITISRDGINSMILNSKGRVVTDCFLYPEPFNTLDGIFDKEMEQPGFLLEVDSLILLQLMMLLKLHKLSAKVDISPDKNLFSYYYYNDTVHFDEWLEEIQFKYLKSQDPVTALQDANSFIKEEVFFNSDIAKNILGFAVDNRIPNFGVKFLSNKPISNDDSQGGIPLESVFSSKFEEQFGVTTIGEDEVIKRRFENGLFETQDAPKGTSLLPFECNLDYLNGLSLDKGCYVGQELTIRSFNNGVIRKRIFPVQFFDINDESLDYLQNHPIELNSSDPIVSAFTSIPESTLTKLEITPLEESSEPASEQQQEASAASPFASTRTIRKRKTSVGKLMSRQDNLGLVLFPVADVEKNQFYKLEVPSLENGHKYIGVKVSIPDWWPE